MRTTRGQPCERERFVQANKVQSVDAAIAIASTMGLAAACRSQVTQVGIYIRLELILCSGTAYMVRAFECQRFAQSACHVSR
jgi:hypothetical protein